MGEGFFVNSEEEMVHPKKIFLGCVHPEPSPAPKGGAVKRRTKKAFLSPEWEDVFLLMRNFFLYAIRKVWYKRVPFSRSEAYFCFAAGEKFF